MKAKLLFMAFALLGAFSANAETYPHCLDNVVYEVNGTGQVTKTTYTCSGGCTVCFTLGGTIGNPGWADFGTSGYVQGILAVGTFHLDDGQGHSWGEIHFSPQSE